MRTLKELIPLMISTLNSNKHHDGLCSVVNALMINDIITSEEYYFLKDFIKTAQPKWYQKRYYCHRGIWDRHRCKDGAYYWTSGEKQPRLNWLNKQLKKQN